MCVDLVVLAQVVVAVAFQALHQLGLVAAVAFQVAWAVLRVRSVPLVLPVSFLYPWIQLVVLEFF
jgi:hypothetical protein